MSGIGEIVMSGRMQKGCYGYVRSERRFQLWKTIILFLLPLALFFGGWITTGSRTTLLTVVAVLGMLPASKSLVGWIMIMRSRTCSREAYDRIEQVLDGAHPPRGIYDLNITTYRVTYQISHAAVRDKTICCYSEDTKTDMQPLQKYLSEALENNGYKGYTFKVFQNLDKYTERLMALSKLEEGTEEDRVLHFIAGLSL